MTRMGFVENVIDYTAKSYPIRHVRLSRLIACLLVFLIIVPLVSHYYLSNIGSESAEDSRLGRNQLAIKDNGDIKPKDTKSHIDDLNRIKASVNNELRELESRRLKLQAEINGYNNHIEKLKTEYELTKKDLEQIKLSVTQARVEKDEILLKNMPDVLAPKRILADASHGDHVSSPLSPQSCHMFSCFDYSRCSILSGFPVYLYQPKSRAANEVLNEFVETSLLSTFEGNPYVTQNAESACVFIVIIGEQRTQDINKKMFETNLHNLPYWNGDGRNHILLSVARTYICQDLLEGINIGRAMVAQTPFVGHVFRPQYDLAIPPSLGIASGDVWEGLPSMSPIRRKYLLYYQGEYLNNIFSVKQDDYEPIEKRKLLGLSQRRHLMALQSLEDIVENEMSVVEVLKNMQSSLDGFRLEFSCSGKKTFGINADWALCGESDTERWEILKQSTFSLIISPTNTSVTSTMAFQVRLYEALKSGAIPVIVGDYVNLPYQDIIHWPMAVVILPKSRVTEMHFFIRTFSDTVIADMRRQGRFIWETYFSSTKKIVDSMLAVVRTRLQIPALPTQDEPSPNVFNSSFVPHKLNAPDLDPETDDILGSVEFPFPSEKFQHNFTQSIVFDTFNKPGDPFQMYPQTPRDMVLPTESKFLGSGYGFRPINKGEGGSGKAFSEALGGNVPREQFTIVMLTYEREAVLINALQRLKGLPYLNRVVVVWNSPKHPSIDLGWPDIGVPVNVVKTLKNSLNNRFLPYSVIETEAILSIDDDAHLRHDEIIFGFRVWREARDRVVGFPGRYHAWDLLSDTWHYRSNYSCELSMVLTGAAFFHKYYSYLYSYIMPQAIRDKVDEFINCEDIAMNFLVSHITRKPPIKVTSRWTFRCPGCPKALSIDDSHFQERHKCMNFFMRVYGYMPLLYTQFRADSVLFKTRLPREEQKCFHFI